jgi:hypothetical protein
MRFSLLEPIAQLTGAFDSFQETRKHLSLKFTITILVAKFF